MNRRHFFASIPLLAALPKLLGGNASIKRLPDIDTMTARHVSAQGICLKSIRGYSNGEDIWNDTGFLGHEIWSVDIAGDLSTVKVGDVVDLSVYGLSMRADGRFGVAGKSVTTGLGKTWTTLEIVPLDMSASKLT